MDNLELIGGHLWIGDNQHLNSISSLVSLDSGSEYVAIWDNSMLSSLTGLNGISIVEEGVLWFVIMMLLPILQDWTILNMLKEVLIAKLEYQSSKFKWIKWFVRN